MDLVRQPPDSYQCGQACVAMICGIPLDEAVMVVRTSFKTRTKQIVAALRSMGIQCDKRLRRGTPLAHQTAILKVTHNTSKRSHWVVWHGGWCYDPASEVITDTGSWYLRDWHTTSFLAISTHPR